MHRDDFSFSQLQRSAFALLRILFGLIWLFNTWFRIQDVHLSHFMETLNAQVAGQPVWIQLYLRGAIGLIEAIGRAPVGVAMLLLTALLALSLLTGLWTRFFAWVGIVYTLLMSSTVGGGFGGPYGPDATDPGTLIVYTVAFVFVLSARAWDELSLSSLFGTAPSMPERKSTSPGSEPFKLGRVLFGLVWAVDAYLKWQPYFLTHVVQITAGGQQGQPAWIVAYIQLFIDLIQAVGPLAFGVLVAVSETLIALSLLTGRWLQFFVPFGILYSLGIWTTAEGFGGPYGLNSTGSHGDVLGAGIIYAYILLYLLVTHHPFHRLRRERLP
jgi:uncharacterized membrane protein YphA (DoxX/SURF4 family)